MNHDKLVAEVMAKAERMAYVYAGEHTHATVPAAAEHAALESAIRSALAHAVKDAIGEPVAQVRNAPEMHMVGPNDGGYYAIEPLTNERLPDGAVLYTLKETPNHRGFK